MAKFLNIDFAACDVHASANVHVIGLPGLPAIDGFVHNLERNFGFITRSWAIAYRDFQMQSGRIRIANSEHKSNNGKNPSVPSVILDKRKASLEGVLIIEIDDLEHEALQSLVDDLNESVEAFRFCGGALMLQSGGVKVWDSVDKAIKSIGRLSRKQHFFIEDKIELLQEAPQGMSRLDWLMVLVSRPQEKTEIPLAKGFVDENGEHEVNGFLSPVIKGYKLLEEPRERPDVRGDYQHAYAESVIGLVRMRSLPSVLTHYRKHQTTPAMFWLNEVDDSQGTLLWEVGSHQI